LCQALGLVREFGLMELRRASVDTKLRQLSVLLAAHPEADVADVR